MAAKVLAPSENLRPSLDFWASASTRNIEKPSIKSKGFFIVFYANYAPKNYTDSYVEPFVLVCGYKIWGKLVKS